MMYYHKVKTLYIGEIEETEESHFTKLFYIDNNYYKLLPCVLQAFLICYKKK